MEKIFNFFRFTNYNPFQQSDDELVLHVVNIDGFLINLRTFTYSTGAEVISSVVELLEASDQFYQGYVLIHVRSGDIIAYNTSMSVAGVVDNDEIYLVKKHVAPNKNMEWERAPTQAMINEITASCVEKTTEKFFGLRHNFFRLIVSDHSYIRNFLIDMATESAYILSTGPYADFLIHYFKLKIMGRRQFREDAVKTLTELGFERSRCIYAIRLKKNIYSEALNWLIDHSEDSTTYSSYNKSTSFIRTSASDMQGKLKSLHEIIRIYGRTGQQYCERLLKSFSEMGFSADDSMNALTASNWDPTTAVASLCEKDESTKSVNELVKHVLELPSVQCYLSDPEIFMTIIYILASGAGSDGIEYNWESTKLKYQSVASILKKYNEEKEFLLMQHLNPN